MNVHEETTLDEPDIRPLPGAWLVVALLWVVGCLNYLDRVMLTTMRDSLKAAIPMGDDDFGALTMVFLVVYGLLSPLGGWCADRFGRSRIIVASLGVWSLVTWLTSYAHTYHELLVSRALMGLSEACYIPAALALIADYHPGATRSRATGIHMSGIYAGASLGGMGGWMADHYSWSSSFFVFGCIGVVFAGALALLLRDVPRADHSPESSASVDPVETMRALGRSVAFWIVAVHKGLVSFAAWAFVTWMPTFLREHYHLSQANAGFTATAYNQVAAFAGVLVGGACADRWSRVELRGRVRVPMIALTLASPFVFITSHTDSLGLAIVCLIAFGFAVGCTDANTMPVLCQVVAPGHRATGYGMLNLFGCTVGGGSAYLGGWLKERNVDVSTLLMGSALGVLLAGLILIFFKPATRG